MLGDCWWEREREGRFLGTVLETGKVGGEVARWWKGGGEDIAVGCGIVRAECLWVARVVESWPGVALVADRRRRQAGVAL